MPSPVRRSLVACLVVLCALSVDPRAQPQPPLYDPVEKTISELQEAMTSGHVTSRQLVEAYLARIAAYDRQGPAITAMVTLNPRAVAQADALDAERKARGPRGPLHGIPIVVKDNYETVEMPTGAGSLALASSHPPRDAFQVKKLRDAGVVIIGKTNMHELAAGITTISSFGGQTRNPYDLLRNPGGSSGGTGAAVAASFAAAGMGSDTCGSIRIPAANHALVGLRGTQGLSSRTGIVPLSHTQDIGGPLARTITDLTIMLDATVGPDPADADTKAAEGRVPKSYREALSADALKGARLGIVRSLFGSAQEDEEVSRLLQTTLDRLKELGAEPIDVVVPGLDDLLRDGSVIVHEFKGDLAAYLKSVPAPPVQDPDQLMREGLFHVALEQTFNQRLGAGFKQDAEAYRKAIVKRGALRQALLSTLDEHRVTALVYPTLRRKPALIGDPQRGTTCQVSAHSGLPALTVPAGFTDDGLPIGIELLGGAFDEAGLLSLGYSIEQATKVRQPPFSAPSLVNGKAPIPRRALLVLRSPAEATIKTAEIDLSLGLSYDMPTGRLTYQATVKPADDELRAVWLHRGTPDTPGPAFQQLQMSPSGMSSGTLRLSFAERRALQTGQLYVEMYTARHPIGAARVPVRLAAP